MKNSLVFELWNDKVAILPCCWNTSHVDYSLKDFFKIKNFNDFLNIKFDNSNSKELCTSNCKFCLGPIKNIQITFIAECNLNCYHCFYNNHKKDSLREKLMWYTLNKLKGFNLDMLSLSGGEIMVLYDELIYYLSSISSNDFRNIRFFTNGLLLDDGRIKTLKKISEKTGVNYIFGFSIDAITKETYEKVRIGGDFNKVLHNLEKVISVFSKNNVMVLNTIKKPNRNEAKLFESFYKEKFNLDDNHICLSYDLLNENDDIDKQIYEQIQNV